MKHNRYIFIVAAIVITIGLAGVIAIGMAGLAMNRHALSTETSLVDNALTEAITETLNGQKAVALWDEAALRVQGPQVDREWINHEMGSFLTAAYGHNQVYIIDSNNRPVYAYDKDRESDPKGYAAVAPSFQPLIRQIREGASHAFRERDDHFRRIQERYARLHGSMYGRWDAHIVDIDGKVAIVSAMTIVPVSDRSLLLAQPYLLLSVIRVDQDRLDGIGSALLIDGLRAVPVGMANAQSGRFEVFSDAGAPIETLVWTARQPGKVLLRYILPLMFAAVLLAAAILLVSLRRMNRMNGKLVVQEREASYLANFDPLSSLPNRRVFSLALERAMSVGPGSVDYPVIAFCDLDEFKQINDTLGHAAGDDLIKVIATRLRAQFPADVLIARFGGDEFAIMRVGRWIDLEKFGADIQQAFAERVELNGNPVRVSISVGLAVAPAHGATAQDLMKNADIALYRAKDDGRGRVVCYDSSMGLQILDRKSKEERLEQVLRSERLELHYQPIVDLRTYRPTGVEALLRWPSDDPDPMGPAEFIPIAESAGMMLELGEWVIQRAFADSLRWPDLNMSINLSPIQIQDPTLLDRLRRHLRNTGAHPDRITFEVTEGVLLNATDHIRKTMDGISAFGFKLALDDFGTGYSSLSYLREFHFDKLKIDRSFIRDGRILDRKTASLVKAVIDVGRALGLQIVAEGIEHIAEAHALRTFGCDEIQGFLCGRALPADQASEHLAKVHALIAAASMDGEVEPRPRIVSLP